MGVCCCVQMCNSVIKHCGEGASTWAKFDGHTYVALVSCCMQKYLLLWECLCCCLQVNYIVYKHFDRSLHIGSSDPRPVSLTVFEILGFKLKKNSDKKKNWRNTCRLFESVNWNFQMYRHYGPRSRPSLYKKWYLTF